MSDIQSAEWAGVVEGERRPVAQIPDHSQRRKSHPDYDVALP